MTCGKSIAIGMIYVTLKHSSFANDALMMMEQAHGRNGHRYQFFILLMKSFS
jgi:hypothetical protein